MTLSLRVRNAAAGALILALAVTPLRAQPFDGTYRRNEAVGERARDHMLVRLLPSGELSVQIETATAGGQTCEVDEVLQLQGDVATFRDIEMAARDWNLTFDGERALITYDGPQRGYCGPGASFRGEWRRESR
jgi:hypothetical protein